MSTKEPADYKHRYKMALARMSPENRHRLKEKIVNAAEIKVDTTTFCYLYKCTYRNFDEYPSLRTPDGSYIKAHRCVYFGTHTTEVPDKSVDISHRCHKKRCVRIDHLVAEKRSQNSLRKACRSANVCLGPAQHDGLECVFPEHQ
jgi:hypothetical protein